MNFSPPFTYRVVERRGEDDAVVFVSDSLSDADEELQQRLDALISGDSDADAYWIEHYEDSRWRSLNPAARW